MKIPNIKFNPYLSTLLLLGVILLAQAVYTPLSNIVKAGLGPASVDIDFIVDPDETYQTAGILVSTNLLIGQATAVINSFGYSASIPENTSLQIQFSQDGDNWYSAGGVADSLTAMADGTNAIDLSGLGWWGNSFYYKIIFASNGLATPALTAISLDHTANYNPVYTVYHATGTLASVNLLSVEASAINGFTYNASSIPAGTSIAVQFSLDNANWYSSTGTPDGWDTLTQGTSTINLSGLGWAGSAFYYRAVFSSNYAQTPVLNSVAVKYAGPDSYWVGGAGNWSDADNHWSDTSGGAPDASNLPGPGSNIHFDANSCSSTCAVSINSAISVKNFNLNNSSATVTQTASTTISENLNVTAGTLAVGTNNLTVTGNSTITGTLTIGASAGTGWTTNNLTIGAGGTASSTAPGTIYYNQVTVSGTLNPDATGTYNVAGVYNNMPYYRRGSDDFYIWNQPATGQWYISEALGIGTNNRWRSAIGQALITLKYPDGTATGIATISTVTASGEYTRLDNSKITINGTFDQSNTSSKFLAGSSLITVNGDGNFTADGTLSSSQYNSASLVLNGNNTLTYNNLGNESGNGFNNLVTGQNSNTTTIANSFAVGSVVTIGSGSLTNSVARTLYLLGSNPFNFDINSRISIWRTRFFGALQNIPTLNNGYDSNLNVAGTQTNIIQTGPITINGINNLIIDGTGQIGREDFWKTNGYNLTVGGNLQIGYGSDTGLKKLDATNYTNPDSNAKSTITVGGNWLNYGNGTAPSQFIHGSSTVVFNSVATGKTITSGSSTSPFYNVNFTGVGGAYTLQDNMIVGGDLNVTAGTLGIGVNNLAVTGNSTITNATTTIGASAGTGWTTNNLTIGAGGTASSTAPGTIYYNQVTVSGTLSPDVTGTYTVAGMYEGRPYWIRSDNNQYLWYYASSNWVITASVPGNLTNPRWYQATAGGPTSLSPYSAGGASGTATVANVTASGEYTRLNNSKITIAGNYDQSATSSKFLAASSLITVNGDGNFTADGTVNIGQYNNSTLVLNGTNTFRYNNNSNTNGFGGLVAGQNGLTTTLMGQLAIRGSGLTIGSGSLLSNSDIWLFDGQLNMVASSKIYLSTFHSYSNNLTLMELLDGYHINIQMGNASTITQSGSVVITGWVILNGQNQPSWFNTWKTNGYNLTVGGNLRIGYGSDTGLKKLDATNYTNPDPDAKSTITVGGNWLNYGNGTAPSQFIHGSSTVIFNKPSGTQTLTAGANSASYPFYNLTHSGAGTLQLLANPVTVTNDFTNSSGTFDANGQDMNVGGVWNNTASYLHGTSTVNLIGSVAQAVMGSSTFYNLTKTVATAATLVFEATKTQVIAGALTLQGVTNQLLTLVSSIPGTSWFINPLGSAVLNFLNISDAVNSFGSAIIATNSKDAGGNSNINFSATTVTWTGASSTDWNTAGNWDTGYVPNTTDNVVIASASNQPVLATSTTVNDLTVNAGATLAIGTNNLTVTGNSTINGTTTIGASAGTGWTTNNLTIGAGGTASSTATGGTPYYNQITTSWNGAPGSPDPSGIYIAKGFYNGKPYYQRGSDNWFIWWNGFDIWAMSDIIGSTLNPSWIYATNSFPPAGWNNYRGSTGSPRTIASTTSGTFTGGIYSKITINGNFDQSNTTSKFLAASSLITVNGDGNFTADGTLSGSQYNSATLALNGNNTLTYNNLVSYSSDGFNNLITGQNGNITINSGDKSILNTLVVGSGTFTGTNNIVLLGSTPLFFDTDSHLSGIGVLFFYGTSQTIPSLNNGYDVNILLRRTGTTVNQTGNVVLNSDKYLRMGWSSSYAPNINTWNTNGYDLNVGGNLEIGGGSDTGLKKLDATNYTNPDPNAKSTITVGGNWLNYGNGTAPSQFIHGSSTVIFNKPSGTQTITSGASNSSFYNLTHSGAGTLQLVDPLVATGDVLLSAGTFDPNGQNITTAGNLTIADGSAVTASGLNLANYYNQVEVSGNGDSPIGAPNGTYTLNGFYKGYPKYTRNGEFNIQVNNAATVWLLYGTSLIGPYWRPSNFNIVGNYSINVNDSTGTATVSNVTSSGLIGSIWTVGGNFSASGQEGALLTLNPSSTWYLNVAGTANTDYVNVANSDASGGTRIQQSNSTDSGNNFNWGFDFTGPTIATTTLSGFTIFGNYIKGLGTIVGGLATDTSGVDGDTCEYTLNSGVSWLAGVWDTDHCQKTGVSISDGEYYTFNTRAKDIISNQGTGTPSITYTGDTTAPATTDDSDDNWHNSDQLIALTASDGFGSGVSSTYYCIDTEGVCEPETLATNSVAVTCAVGNICENYVRYYSVDNLGNAESVKTSNLVRIDKSLPIISNLNPASGAVVARTGQNVTFTTSKPADCRFASAPKAYAEMTGDYSCSVANSIQMSCVLPTLSYGVNDFYFACRDFLGNADSAESATKASYNLPAAVVLFFSSTPVPVINLTPPTSTPITTTPVTSFAVIIDNGAKVTAKPKVTIKLTAEPGTTAVIIATNPDFSNAIILPFVASPTGQASFEYDLCQGRSSCLNQKYTIYTKFLDASGLASPAFSANINLKLPTLTPALSTIGAEVGEMLSGIKEFFAPLPEPVMSFPPIEIAVTKETPLAFQGKWPLVLPSMRDFVLAGLPQDFINIANKFPQVASTLKDVGITRMSDAGSLEFAKISLPGLTESAGISGLNNIAISDISGSQAKQIPTNMIFARGGENNLDLNVKLSISNSGTAIQALNTVQGRPLTLAIKPDQPAVKVKGYLILKSTHAQNDAEENPVAEKLSTNSVLDLLAQPANASEVKAVNSSYAPARPATENGKELPDLVLSQFDYQEAENGIWTADLISPFVLGQYELRTVVEYKNKQTAPETVSMVVIVDPEGYVYRKLSDGSEARIAGAIVSIHWLNPETEQFELWPATNFRQENPQTTDVTGRYAFLVPPGDYYITAVASGYGDYRSEVFKVEENKGVFMNLELKEKLTLGSFFGLQNILLAGILLVLVYFAVIFTIRKKSA